VFLSEDRHLGDGATCRAVSRTELLPYSGYIFRGLQMRDQKRDRGSVFRPVKKPFNRDYLENGKSQHYMSIRPTTYHQLSNKRSK